MTWESQFSFVSTDRSWNLSRNLFLNAVFSASSAIINRIVWFNSSSYVVNRIIPFYFWHHSDVIRSILSFRKRFTFFGDLIRTIESILYQFWSILSHLRRRNYLRNLGSDIVCWVSSSEFSFRFWFFWLSFIFWTRKSLFQTFQIFWNNYCLEKTSFTCLTIVLTVNIRNWNVFESSWMK